MPGIGRFAVLSGGLILVLTVGCQHQVPGDPEHPSIPSDSESTSGGGKAWPGLTLVRDPKGLVPLPATGTVTVLDVFCGDDRDGSVHPGDGLVTGLQTGGRTVHRLALRSGSTAAERDRIRREVRAAEILIVALSGRGSQDQEGASVAVEQTVDLVRDHPRWMVLAFGNPDRLRGWPESGACLCTVDRGSATVAAMAAALLGRAPITGRLRAGIVGWAVEGSGVSRYRGLTDAPPETEGFPRDLEPRIRTLLEAQVESGAFPGAVALVARRGRVVARVAVGRETYAGDAPRITTASIYDLASLTKVCATLPAITVLLDRGLVHLDDRVSQWVPGFQGPGKDEVTLRHLMVHSSGLPAYIRFFAKGLEGKANFVAASAKTGLAYPPGSRKVYSDLGLMLLMAVIEKASGKTLDRFLAEDIYPELGIHARFVPADTQIDAVPTERDPWRERVVRGEVHDENAYAMGGVSGHAGLFGSADDVARIGLLFLGGGGGVFSPVWAERMIRRDGMVARSSRALLWDTFVPGGSGGSKLAATSFGHTGFTGTSIWCDPRRDLCVVLLTNRVHPTRKNRRISAARRALHDLIVDSL